MADRTPHPPIPSPTPHPGLLLCRYALGAVCYLADGNDIQLRGRTVSLPEDFITEQATCHRDATLARLLVSEVNAIMAQVRRRTGGVPRCVEWGRVITG